MQTIMLWVPGWFATTLSRYPLPACAVSKPSSAAAALPSAQEPSRVAGIRPGPGHDPGPVQRRGARVQPGQHGVQLRVRGQPGPEHPLFELAQPDSGGLLGVTRSHQPASSR